MKFGLKISIVWLLLHYYCYCTVIAAFVIHVTVQAAKGIKDSNIFTTDSHSPVIFISLLSSHFLNGRISAPSVPRGSLAGYRSVPSCPKVSLSLLIRPGVPSGPPLLRREKYANVYGLRNHNNQRSIDYFPSHRRHRGRTHVTGNLHTPLMIPW